MNSASTLKLFKSGDYQYIYIYFKHKGSILRIPTKMKYVEGMHKQDLTYNAKYEGYKVLNRQILNLKALVDQFISTAAFYRTKLSQQECLEFIKTGSFNTEKTEEYKTLKTKDFFDYYNDFLEFKQTELQNRDSLKDYKSLENALKDYQTHTKKKLTFDVVNDVDFFNRFRNYLYSKHSDDSLTSGEMNANTVNKRFSSLKTFFRYVQAKKYFKFDSALFDYRIKKYRVDIVTLSRAEIKQLEELQIDNPYWQKIIDVFVCNCFLSLRYSDLKTMHKGEFKQDAEGDWFFTKRNEKTNFTIEIPITKTAYRILEKYGFNLPVLTNQYFNRELKEILKHYKLFPETVKKTEIRNGQNITTEYVKRDLISTHTARRTFITNAVDNNVPLNVIQSCTGHTNLRTLSIYVKANRNKQQVSKID